LNLQAPAEKRPRLDVIELQGTGSGMPNQSTREEFPRTSRLPLHGGNVEGGERWAEPHPSQTLPMHPEWLPAAQWHQDNNQYAGDMYIIGAPPINWHNEQFNTPQWQNPGMAYNTPVGGQWQGKMPIGIPNAPQLRYTCGLKIVDLIYIDRDDYPVERREMYEEGEHIQYARAPIRYVSNQLVVGNAPPLLPTCAKRHTANPQPSTEPMRASAHGKGHQPASTPNFW
jgi:hypothetical protein